MYCLQSRWRLEKKYLIYYGMRNKRHLLKNIIKLNNNQRRIIAELPCNIKDKDIKYIREFIGEIIVEKCNKKEMPRNIDEARFCVGCAANDFIIPGLEFDENGFCPMCQTVEETKEFKGVLPIMNDFPKAKHSRFDVALFYTGGKDSTYLLYYLSKVKGLRVLALTWEIPFMSSSAKASIENAKKSFQNVEFISRYISNKELKTIYSRLYELNGNTCACPSLAYLLFYPELVANRVPYFVAGNEPAQVLGLYYNGMAPKIAYRFSGNKSLNFLVNVGRVLTLHPPLKKGQLHTLTTMKQLAYGQNKIAAIFGYKNELVQNITDSIHTVPEMTAPLKRAIRSSSRSGNIPAFVQIDLDEICGGKYNWDEIRTTLKTQCNWVFPEENSKSLHTSCCVEKCKEYSQFVRFLNMESPMIPFSAIEISLASRGKNLSREEAIEEIRTSLGFSLKEPEECELMRGYFCR